MPASVNPIVREGTGSAITVVFTGGTFGMGRQPDRGVVPLGAGVPAVVLSNLGGISKIESIVWGDLPSMHLSFLNVIALAKSVRQYLASESNRGVVIVQGTDAIEETSFAFDLLLSGPKPVVVTGSIYPFDDDRYDGLDNLRGAVTCANDGQLRSYGTVVVFAGMIHAARDVVKVHPSENGAFESPHAGPIGTVSNGIVSINRAPSSGIRLITNRATLPIPLITAVFDSDGSEIRAAANAGVSGIVVAAAGSGQTPRAFFRECKRAMSQGIPIVMASRAADGRPAPVYGYDAGGIEWLQSGAISAGSLSGPKARVALALALAAGFSDAELRAFFESWDDRPNGARASSRS